MGIARADGYDCRCRMRISEGEMMTTKKDIENQIISLSWKIGKGWKKDPRILKLQAKKRQINAEKNLKSWGLK